MNRVLVYWATKEVSTYNRIEDFFDGWDEGSNFSDVFMITDICGDKITHLADDEIITQHESYLEDLASERENDRQQRSDYRWATGV